MKLFRHAILLAALLSASLPVLAGGHATEASQPTVMITGSNRGIGLGFVEQYADAGYKVIATARKPEEAEELQALAADNDNIVIEQLDVTDYERIDELAAKYADQPIDIFISNAGITPKYKSAFRPVSGVDFDMARRSYEVNALAPLKIAQAFGPVIAASEQKKYVVISTKAGSFALGPEMPMMYEYRGSKAALNMFMHTLSFESQKTGFIVTMMSPGQVNTTPGMQMKIAIEVDESVSKMRTVIDSITPEQNGKFLDYEDGAELPF